MPDFNEIFKPPVKEARYIIQYDPMDEDTIIAKASGKNVFIVYDKNHIRVTTKVWTKLNYDNFVTKFLQKENVKEYNLSKKFINQSI